MSPSLLKNVMPGKKVAEVTEHGHSVVVAEVDRSALPDEFIVPEDAHVYEAVEPANEDSTVFKGEQDRPYAVIMSRSLTAHEVELQLLVNKTPGFDVDGERKSNPMLQDGELAHRAIQAVVDAENANEKSVVMAEAPRGLPEDTVLGMGFVHAGINQYLYSPEPGQELAQAA